MGRLLFSFHSLKLRCKCTIFPASIMRLLWGGDAFVFYLIFWTGEKPWWLKNYRSKLQHLRASNIGSTRPVTFSFQLLIHCWIVALCWLPCEHWTVGHERSWMDCGDVGFPCRVVTLFGLVTLTFDLLTSEWVPELHMTMLGFMCLFVF